MEPLSEPTSTAWSFPFTPQDWEQTPPAVQAYLLMLRDEMSQLHERIEALEARLHHNSTTSSRPPSSDSPSKRPRRRTGTKRSRQGGGTPGHQGLARCSRRLPRSKTCYPHRVSVAVTSVRCSAPTIRTK